MANDRVRIILYCDGDITTGPNGSAYSTNPRSVIMVDRSTRMLDLLRIVHQKFGIDSRQFRIKFIVRYPYIVSNPLMYTHVPIEDDNFLYEVLSIPKIYPILSAVELYIVKESVMSTADCEDNTSFAHDTNVGSSTQQQIDAGLQSGMLENDWYHYGSYIAGDVSLPCHSNMQRQYPTDEGPSNRNMCEEPIIEQHLHVGGSNTSMHDLSPEHDYDAFYDDDDDDDDMVTDSEHEEDHAYVDSGDFPEDEAAGIPFYSDIGEERDSFVDQFSSAYRDRPVWQDDHTSQLEVGMIFKSKEGVQHAVKCWSIRMHRYFKVHESTPEVWYVRCLYFKDKNCLWHVRAKLKKKHGFFELTKMNLRHTCFPEIQPSNHPNLDCNMVGRLVRHNVTQNVSYKVVDVLEDVRALGTNISYKKAWLGRRKAIEMVFGNWESSYTLLPKFLLALQSCNPGTVVEWQHSQSSSGPFNIFHSVFWAFKPCIDGFKHCRPVISIDGTFQYGKYREKILIAVAADAAGHILPLAFAIVDEESLANWSWFLQNLKKHVILHRHGICMLSDRAKGIIRAVETDRELQPPLVFHRYCLRHVKANFSERFKNNALTDLMHQAACAHQLRKWESTMASIRQLNERAYHWLMQIPLDKWALSHDGGFRYGIMTTNRSESFNGVLKGARKLPITACVRATFYRMVKFFNNYRNDAEKLVTGGNPWPPAIQEKFLRNELKSKYHRVTCFFRSEGLYEVTTGVHGDRGGNLHTVRLNDRTCTCGKFTIYKMPCSHVMKVCENMGNASIDLVDNCYTSKEMVNTYSSHFQPMIHEDYWPAQPFHLIANPHRMIRQPGRPRSTRIRNEMDRRRTQRCRICGEDGHNRSRCPNADRLRERVRTN